MLIGLQLKGRQISLICLRFKVMRPENSHVIYRESTKTTASNDDDGNNKNNNLDKVNLEAMLVGQQLCGVAAGSAEACRRLHFLAWVCFALLIFADHCLYSWTVISAGFCSLPPPPG